jgi:hypothetical protein
LSLSLIWFSWVGTPLFFLLLAPHFSVYRRLFSQPAFGDRGAAEEIFTGGDSAWQNND